LIIQLVLSFLLIGRALSHAYTMVASPAFNPDIPTSENGAVDYEYLFWGLSGGIFTEGGCAASVGIGKTGRMAKV
jgi:hypothetical protein